MNYRTMPRAIAKTHNVRNGAPVRFLVELSLHCRSRQGPHGLGHAPARLRQGPLSSPTKQPRSGGRGSPAPPNRQQGQPMREPMPTARFYRLIQQTRPPERADRSALGTLPTRAYRYCDAITSATAFGWYVFPPMDMQLLWDGSDIFWRYKGVAEWLPLQPAAQFPGQSARFDAAAPRTLRGCSPPFLTAIPEPGTLQIWTGLMVRAAPDWSLLVRAPANLPGPGGYTLYEGIIESDRWFGPLFTNLRLTRSHIPICLRADFPLALVQPIPRLAYADETVGAMSLIADMDGMTDEDWEEYRTTIAVPNEDPDRPFGAYAVRARKRRKGACPFARAVAA